MFDDGVVGTVGEVVEVLDGGDGSHAPRRVDLLGRGFGQPEMPHLPGVDGIGQRAHLFGEGIGGIDAVQVHQVDDVAAEAAEAEFHLLAQVVGMSERHPGHGVGPHDPDLGGEHDVGHSGQSLTEQPFALPECVGVGGVEQVHPGIRGLTHESREVGAVGGRGPHRRARSAAVRRPVGEAHGAKADTAHVEVAAEFESRGSHGEEHRC